MLPVFWLALYGTRDQLAIGIAGLGAVFFVPLVLLGAPEYPSTEWRTAILWICVAPIVGYTVQALVAELRSRAEETRLALAHIEAITVAMREIGASTDPEARPPRRLRRRLARSHGADVVQLLEPNADDRLALTAAVGMRIPRAGEEAGGGLAYLTRKPVFLREATHGARHGVRSMHFEPVLRDESAVAVLVLGWAEPVKRLSQGVESGMQMLSAEAAIALDRARLLAQLQETARTDDLTGLPNRRAWDEELPRELARASRDCPTGLRRDARPRPLQAVQRPPWASGRRPAAQAGGLRVELAPPQERHAGALRRRGVQPSAPRLHARGRPDDSSAASGPRCPTERRSRPGSRAGTRPRARTTSSAARTPRSTPPSAADATGSSRHPRKAAAA